MSRVLRFVVVVVLFNELNRSLTRVNKSNINPFTPRVEPWVTETFLTFDSMDRTLKCDHSLESC